MFKNCTSLLQAPILKPMILAEDCYHHMFSGCKNLKVAYLPAISLAKGCYVEMFKDCKNLQEIWLGAEGDFSTRDKAGLYFADWVLGCSNHGVIHKKPNCLLSLNDTFGVHRGWKIVDDYNENFA